jgi:hypothetical protein
MPHPSQCKSLLKNHTRLDPMGSINKSTCSKPYLAMLKPLRLDRPTPRFVKNETKCHPLDRVYSSFSSPSSVMLGRLVLALLTLVSLPVRLLGSDDGSEKGASKSSSLAQAMLILERFSRVTGIVRLAPFRLDEEDGLRGVKSLCGSSSSIVLGLGAAQMILYAGRCVLAMQGWTMDFHCSSF